MRRPLALALTLALVAHAAAQQPARPNQQQQQTPPAPLPAPKVRAEDYRDEAAALIGAALTDDTAYRRLAYLADRIGHRLSGSPQLAEAVRWAVAEMKRDGLDNVRAEKVMVPHWVRGEESLELLEPVGRKLVMLGLGGSVGTPPEGVAGEVTVVRSFDELEALGEKVRGKIVLYNVPFTNYGATVQYRSAGASRAARYGAAAALVRSVTPTSLQTPHTGSLRYADDQPKIPSAAVTIEAAEMLQRMQERGERPRVRLKMGAQTLPDAESANVVAEIRGRERPDEVVVIGGHIDSWDVGQGAHDDGGGCVMAWEAVRLLKKLNLRPRRTVRVVLWTNEENGLRGGEGYRDAHKAEVAKHVLAIEADSGTLRPVGFGLAENAPPQARADMTEIGKLLSVIKAGQIAPNGGGADVGPLARDGVIVAGLNVDGPYFNYHHTPADTFDKIDPQDMALCVAAMAVMAYVVADMPTRLGQ